MLAEESSGDRGICDWFWLKTLKLFCQFSDLSMIQTLWMKEFSYCTSQLELISVTSNPKSLNEQKNIIKSNRRAKNCQWPPLGTIYFQHCIQRCSLICMGPCQLYMKYLTYILWSFPNIQALHKAFLRGQCFSISFCSQELKIWFFYMESAKKSLSWPWLAQRI